MERIAPKYRVLAPDSYGSGKSPEWPSDTVITLADEVAFLEPVFADAGSRFALVGHSYGAAVALVAALAHRERIRALALFEPTLFSLVDADCPPPNDADGIRDTVARASRALDAGDRDGAAACFIDYWMETGSWAKTPDAQKPAISASVANVRRWAHALLTEPTPLSAFRALDMPVLYMMGKRSTPSAHAVARLLVKVLPAVEVIEFEDMGHMGPVTNAGQVNQAIEQFLDQIQHRQ